MFIDLLSESCEEERNFLEFLYWVTKISQHFADTFFQISLDFWLSFTNQSSDILQHSQNRPTGDRWLKFKKMDNPDSEIKFDKCK